MTYQAQRPTEARRAVEEAGQAIAQLWQTQGNQQQADLRRQFQEMLQQVESAWIAVNLQEEFFQEYVEQWIALGKVGLLEEVGSHRSESVFHWPVAPQIPERESSGVPELETSPPPQLVENPQWIALTQTLQQWQTRRQKLLEDRTPIHPEVHQADLWIAQTESLLAKTPRWLSPPDASSPPFLPQSSQNDAQSLASLSSEISPPSWDGPSGEPTITSNSSTSNPSRPTVPPHRGADRTPPPSSGQSARPEANRVRLREFGDRLEEFRSFWEVFAARQMQGQQIVQQRLSQAQEILRRLDEAAPAGLVYLQSSVRPVGEMTPVGSETWLWKLGGLSLIAALAAAALSRAALRRQQPTLQPPIHIPTQSPPSLDAQTPPPGMQQRNKTEGLLCPAPISQPPNRPVLQSSFSPSNVSLSKPAFPASPNPSSKADRNPELETLEDCIRTLEELQASLSVPVIGGAAHVPCAPKARLSANPEKS